VSDLYDLIEEARIERAMLERRPDPQTGFIEDTFAMDEPEDQEYCERCDQMDEVHGPQCPEHPDYDPTPWCPYGHRTKEQCDCGPLADND